MKAWKYTIDLIGYGETEEEAREDCRYTIDAQFVADLHTNLMDGNIEGIRSPDDDELDEEAQ